MKQRKYIQPDIEVVTLTAEDILSASPDNEIFINGDSIFGE